MLQKIVVCL